MSTRGWTLPSFYHRSPWFAAPQLDKNPFFAIFSAIGNGAYRSVWNAVANLTLGAQLWVLLVIPLGVLASSDAARRGRRGWLAAFIALTVLAVVAPLINGLANTIHDLLSPPDAPSLLDLGWPSSFIFRAGLALAFLPIPLAAVIYTFMPAQSAARAQSGTGQGTRRLIVVGAVIGFIVMGILGLLGNFPILEAHILVGPRPHTLEQILHVTDVRLLLLTVWFMLLDAFPVAIASLAMVDAARAGRRGWVASWIVLAVLAVLVAGLIAFVVEVMVLVAIVPPGGVVPFGQQLEDASIAAPLVVALVALAYVLTTRPEPRSPA